MPSVYRPLDSTGRQIRLLDIFPSKDKSARLNCTLTYTALAVENKPYEALSYTWGYPEANRLLLLDGQAMKITESLEAALLRLRRPDKVRTLWTDAICINQADVEEKANQIYLMDSIYKCATQVVIWLGEPDDANRSAMMSLAVKNFSITNNFRIWRTQRKHGVQRGIRDGFNASLNGELDPSTAGLEAEIGLVAQLLDRPWWQRVWIVQEVILARKTVIMCGPDEVPWENVKTRLGGHLYGLKSESGIHRPLRSRNGTVVDSSYRWPDAEYHLLDTMQIAWRSGTLNLSFYDLLYQFRRFHCSLPQDRIFAYLGLVSEEQNAGISVDYKVSVAQLYRNVARSLIAAHKHLLVLNCRREPCSVRAEEQQTRLYSMLNQGRFVDPQATINDESTGKLRKGWIRLPEGWERILDDDDGTTWFRDHKTGEKRRESPLKGCTSAPQSFEDFRHLPTGWRKTWDSLGKVKFIYAPGEAHHDRTIDLPSWVPNWDMCSTRDPEPLPLLSDPDSCFWASGKNQRVQFSEMSDNTSNVLGLRGMLFDTIKTIAPPWCPDTETLPISRSGVKTLESWEHLALKPVENCPYGGSTEARFNAFWRTHLADYAGEDALSEQDRIIFEGWCDRTHWTPKTADLEQTFRSNWHLADTPSEDMALGTLFTHICEPAVDEAADLTLGEIPKFVFNMTKDAIAQQRYVKQRYKEIRSRIYRASVNRAMFVTSNGYIGLAPWNAREGDIVVVLLGGCTPYILRSVAHGFTLVGETYVYGIMSGELFGDDIEHADLFDFEIL